MSRIFVLLCFILVASSGFVNGSVKKTDIEIYELKKGNFSAKFTNWGATIISAVVPDNNGKLDDVVLGYDSVKDYMNDTTYFGAIVGRVANRIGGAQFTLNGTHYKLVANEGKNMLHGGLKGFSDVVWNVRNYQNSGFPGDLQVTVTYILLGENQLSVKMKAKALHKPTPVNLAQHSYWNLGGHNSGSILNEEIQIFGSKITVVDKELIPTGKLAPVKGTPYDFLKPQIIGSRIKQIPKGYDINYALDGSSNKIKNKNQEGSNCA
ncbi:Aldose 1-epimerase [Quillaja saponaria]|uniref:Aldose 1-epimerase n=1 Tax=Quillaja saponaria TaxID=32244 RepID=A0AAD7VCI9_QUISA|nr:Aldose 1-epimerase [Quillaja saponaria]